MRLSIVLLLASLAGVLLGAYLIGIPALGAAVIFDSLCVGAWALVRETPDVKPQATVIDVLERARRAA